MKRHRCLLLTVMLLCLTNTTAKASLKVLGKQNVAVILIDYVNKRERLDPEILQQTVFKAPYSLAKFIKDSSYSRAQLVGDVYGWINGEKLGQCGAENNREFLNFLIKKKIPIQEYDYILAYGYTAGDKACPDVFIGHSTIGKEDIKTKKGVLNMGVAHLNIENRFVRPRFPHHNRAQLVSPATAHEFGHSLGASHANLYECFDKALVDNNKLCKQEAIADMSTIMSGESIHRYALHHSACAKEEFGWLQETEVKRLTVKNIKAKAKVLTLSSYESQVLGQLKAVRIDLDEPIQVPSVNPKYQVFINRLYIEYRRAEGFDSWIETLKEPLKHYSQLVSVEGKPVEINTAGVLIRGVQILRDRCATTWLFDTRPNSLRAESEAYTLYDSLDSFLNKGRSFYEPYNDIRIEALGESGGQFKIKIY